MGFREARLSTVCARPTAGTSGAPARFVGLAAAALGLVLFGLTGASPASGQEETAAAERPATEDYRGGGIAPTIETGSTVTHVQPRATVRINRPAYVAVFELKPGAGAVLLQPSNVDDPEMREAGSFSFRLNGRQISNHRKRFYRHLGHRAERAGSIRDWAYLVVIASPAPLRFETLRSKRVYEQRNSDNTEELIQALLAEVVSEKELQEGAFGWALHSFPKLRDRNYGGLADDPYVGG